MSRYDDYYRSRSSHHQDRSSNHAYSGGGYPTSYEESRQVVAQPKLLTYEPQTPFYPPESPSNLQVSESHSRPRSLPPPAEYHRSIRGRRRERGHTRDEDSDDSDNSRARTPIEKARNFVDNAFTDSTAGLGIGVLGALVGGLAAREAVDATNKHNGPHHDAERKRTQLIGTMVGAAVGALGANAVEKRLEVHRDKDRVKQEKWDRKHRPGAADVVEKREIATRPRSTAGDSYGWKRDWDPWDKRNRDRAGSRGLEREVDPDARSWKNVEDWLYDEQNDTRPRSSGRRSEEGEYRY
ncbi:hypothetical protein GGR54DRAFT_206551 [Hypoxylon sp. NC1633]|nr:hypothetical protein GGR54DRAFT_206551 [Hypoxylon sp. NC1633]